MILYCAIGLPKSLLQAISELFFSFGINNTIIDFLRKEIQQPGHHHIIAARPLFITCSKKIWSFAGSIDEAKLFLGWECYKDRPLLAQKSFAIKDRIDQIHTRGIWSSEVIRMISVYGDTIPSFSSWCCSVGDLFSYLWK